MSDDHHWAEGFGCAAMILAVGAVIVAIILASAWAERQ